MGFRRWGTPLEILKSRNKSNMWSDGNIFFCLCCEHKHVRANTERGSNTQYYHTVQREYAGRVVTASKKPHIGGEIQETANLGGTHLHKTQTPTGEGVMEGYTTVMTPHVWEGVSLNQKCTSTMAVWVHMAHCVPGMCPGNNQVYCATYGALFS